MGSRFILSSPSRRLLSMSAFCAKQARARGFCRAHVCSFNRLIHYAYQAKGELAKSQLSESGKLLLAGRGNQSISGTTANISKIRCQPRLCLLSCSGQLKNWLSTVLLPMILQASVEAIGLSRRSNQTSPAFAGDIFAEPPFISNR